MTYSWKTCAYEIKDFVYGLLNDIKSIVKDNFIGFYLHGSLAMGGFNPKNSDIDLLVVTKKPLTLNSKRQLVMLLLKRSNNPYPVEISFLSDVQLKNWKHPSPFEFHYSESWRDRYKCERSRESIESIQDNLYDADLAAHITVTNYRGICLEGKVISDVFPIIPRTHYISSIMEDFQDCLKNMVDDPIYCGLNLLRVYWYLKEGVISSKEEAGIWGEAELPIELKTTVQKLGDGYSNSYKASDFDKVELLKFKEFISSKVQALSS